MKGSELNPSTELPVRTTRNLIPEGSNARETAYQIIRDKIVRLELRPGEPLSDKLLAEELNMSRTPVREAVILLAAFNMVVLRPQIGTFVAPIDTELMEMEQFARFALEKEILTQACPLLTEEHHWLYTENLRTYRHYSKTEVSDRATLLLSLDNEFHRIAFLAAGKEKNFDQMLRTLHHVERMRMLSVAGLNVDQIYDDHMAICTNLLAGNLSEALEALDLHLNRYKGNLPSLQAKYPEYFTIGK